MIHEETLMLPDRPIGKTHSWHAKVAKNAIPGIAMIVNTNASYEGTEQWNARQLQKIVLEPVITLDTRHSADTVTLKDQKATGWAYFDHVAGRLVEMKLHQAMTVEQGRTTKHSIRQDILVTLK